MICTMLRCARTISFGVWRVERYTFVSGLAGLLGLAVHPQWSCSSVMHVLQSAASCFWLVLHISQIIFTCESSYCFQRILAIAILSVCPSVHPSHGWISQKRCKLRSLHLHCRLPARL